MKNTMFSSNSIYTSRRRADAMQKAIVSAFSIITFVCCVFLEGPCLLNLISNTLVFYIVFFASLILKCIALIDRPCILMNMSELICVFMTLYFINCFDFSDLNFIGVIITEAIFFSFVYFLVFLEKYRKE